MFWYVSRLGSIRNTNYINREPIIGTVFRITNNNTIKGNAQKFELIITNLENDEKKFPIIKPK